MSLTVLSLIQSFVSGRLSADEFCNAYMKIYKFERDSSLKDVDLLDMCLSIVFCQADAYAPDEGRLDDEYDEKQLREKVTRTLDDYVVSCVVSAQCH